MRLYPDGLVRWLRLCYRCCVERGRIRHKSTDTFFHVEIERENDGRWAAEITDLPGVMAYGATKDEVIRRVYVLALRVLADRVEHNENIAADLMPFAFVHS